MFPAAQRTLSHPLSHVELRQPFRTTVTWNCIYYNMHAYQQSLLSDMPTLVASAIDQANPRTSIDVVSIPCSLKRAVKVSVRYSSMRLHVSMRRFVCVLYERSHINQRHM